MSKITVHYHYHPKVRPGPSLAGSRAVLPSFGACGARGAAANEGVAKPRALSAPLGGDVFGCWQRFATNSYGKTHVLPETLQIPKGKRIVRILPENLEQNSVMLVAFRTMFQHKL